MPEPSAPLPRPSTRTATTLGVTFATTLASDEVAAVDVAPLEPALDADVDGVADAVAAPVPSKRVTASAPAVPEPSARPNARRPAASRRDHGEGPPPGRSGSWVNVGGTCDPPLPVVSVPAGAAAAVSAASTSV